MYNDTRITLIECTNKGNPRAAAELLVFAKSTRLNMSPDKLVKLALWTDEAILNELEAIASTIPSSWEFLDYTFMIENVTRAFTHQFVRTRHASFAQQTMRVLDMTTGMGWGFGTGPSIPFESEADDLYRQHMYATNETYKKLISLGVNIEDARGVLPTNIHTNILVKMNLRTLVETVRKRSSPRVQGEYRHVLEQMTKAAIEEHPWLHLFFDRTEDALREKLYREIEELTTPLIGPDGEKMHWPDNILSEQRLKMIKLVDELFGRI